MLGCHSNEFICVILRNHRTSKCHVNGLHWPFGDNDDEPGAVDAVIAVSLEIHFFWLSDTLVGGARQNSKAINFQQMVSLFERKPGNFSCQQTTSDGDIFITTCACHIMLVQDRCAVDQTSQDLIYSFLFQPFLTFFFCWYVLTMQLVIRSMLEQDPNVKTTLLMYMLSYVWRYFIHVIVYDNVFIFVTSIQAREFVLMHIHALHDDELVKCMYVRRFSNHSAQQWKSTDFFNRQNLNQRSYYVRRGCLKCWVNKA